MRVVFRWRGVIVVYYSYFIISLKINAILKLMYCKFEHYILHEKLPDRLCLKSYTISYLSLYSFSRQPYGGYAKNIYFHLPYLFICHFYTTALNNTTTHHRNTRACSTNKLFNCLRLPNNLGLTDESTANLSVARGHKSHKDEIKLRKKSSTHDSSLIVTHYITSGSFCKSTEVA